MEANPPRHVLLLERTEVPKPELLDYGFGPLDILCMFGRALLVELRWFLKIENQLSGLGPVEKTQPGRVLPSQGALEGRNFRLLGPWNRGIRGL
jgi:hypothetical protein